MNPQQYQMAIQLHNVIPPTMEEMDERWVQSILFSDKLLTKTEDIRLKTLFDKDFGYGYER